MTQLHRGIAVAVIHVVIVSSLGVTLLIDRSTRPRVWARVAPYDPDLPIRGRYVRLQIEGTAEGVALSPSVTEVSIDAHDGRLVFVPRRGADRQFALTRTVRGNTTVSVLSEPVAFFIPEHVPDPSVRAADEELWAEVTLPRKGAPRPIRLGVKKNGVLTPLQ